MKKVTVITDSLSAISPELAKEYEVMVVPYHLVFDGKDYLDDTFNRDELFKRLESYKNLPTHSACSSGEILDAFREAGQRAEGILFIALSSTMSADYDAALKAKEIVKEELPNIAIEVVDSRSVIAGELLIVLAAARAAREGKSLSEVTEIAYRVVEQVTHVNVPETVFFFERSGRASGGSAFTKAPVPIYPLIEMDAASGGTGKFITKNRTKAKAIEALLEMVKEKIGGKKLHAAIGYTNNPEEAEALKKKLLSQFEVSELHITPWSTVGCVVGGPRCLSMGFYGED